MSRTRHSLRLIVTGVAAALLVATGPASAQVEMPKVRFSLGWLFQATQSTFTLGVDKGYYKAEGLEVLVDRGTGSQGTITRIAGGSHDMGYTDIGTLAKYNAENPGKEMVAVYLPEEGNPVAVMTLKGKGIDKPKDLEGRKLGAPSFDGGRQMFPAFAKVNKLDSGKISWQTMDAQLREPMLARGEVDAITGFVTSAVLSLEAVGVKRDNIVVLKYQDHGVDGFGNAVVASRDFIDKNPKTVAAFVRATNKALRDVVATPRAALDSLKSRDPLVNMDIEARRMALHLSDVVLTPYIKANGLSAVDPKKLERAIAAVLDAYNLKVALPNDRVFTDRFLPSRAERAVPAQGPI